jgi:uncharacterized integral membrane protein
MIFVPLVRIMAIVFLIIALAILAVSNPLPMLNLAFLGRQTVPIPLGLLGLAALGSGLTAGLGLRVALWSYVASRSQKSEKKLNRRQDQVKPEFSYQPPLAAEETALDEPPDRFDNYSRPAPRPVANAEPEPDKNIVHDANYRVIKPPQNTPSNPAARPQVDSTLKPDNQDWGFDFDDEE